MFYVNISKRRLYSYQMVSTMTIVHPTLWKKIFLIRKKLVSQKAIPNKYLHFLGKK